MVEGVEEGSGKAGGMRSGNGVKSLLGGGERLGGGQNGQGLAELKMAVHDLCQPLTALRFRLELGQLEGGLEELRVAIDESLAQCDRLTGAVEKIRRAVQKL